MLHLLIHLFTARRSAQLNFSGEIGATTHEELLSQVKQVFGLHQHTDVVLLRATRSSNLLPVDDDQEEVRALLKKSKMIYAKVFANLY